MSTPSLHVRSTQADGYFFWLALLLSLFVHDYLEDRRIHRATWMVTLFIVLVNVAAISISQTSTGSDFVHYLGGR